VTFEGLVDDFVEVFCERRSFESGGKDERFGMSSEGRVGVENEELVDYGIEFRESN